LSVVSVVSLEESGNRNQESGLGQETGLIPCPALIPVA